ncbi:MAG: cyclopropane-fatty-acyl-phospholipid synthase family protein, partial [Alphaproteobacteria bacterium]|nr:cyclopropane-fatty-acyl-phospholipid synthase family protein [Alphaproteobacteria bacterium]
TARKGDAGFAEDYRDGRWHTGNLTNLLLLALMNESAVKNYIFGSPIAQKICNLSYLLRMNTLKGSRRNIHAHYDVGNDFYKLWLDPTMTYSSALFKSDTETLMQGQHNKYDRLLDRLDKNSGSLLEIGCGWGGFAERAVGRGDYDLKGITISAQQHDFAQQRLGKKAHIALEDYRIQNGKFDNIVSIEMFEALGEKYWPTYFNKVGALLNKNGKAVIQTITIDEPRFDRYRRGSDFIRSHIFPGGMLPTISRFESDARNSGLQVADRFTFGQDYARTLELWLADFDNKAMQIRSLGYEEGFMRMWRFYFASCIAGFRTGRINVMQATLQHA